MKTLDFSKLKFSEKLEKQFADINETYSPKKVLKNMLVQTAQKKYTANGTTMEKQRLYAKTYEKLEGDGVEPVELSDEQFEFLFDSIMNTQMGLNTALPVIADFLEEVKFKKEPEEIAPKKK